MKAHLVEILEQMRYNYNREVDTIAYILYDMGRKSSIMAPSGLTIATNEEWMEILNAYMEPDEIIIHDEDGIRYGYIEINRTVINAEILSDGLVGSMMNEVKRAMAKLDLSIDIREHELIDLVRGIKQAPLLNVYSVNIPIDRLHHFTYGIIKHTQSVTLPESDLIDYIAGQVDKVLVCGVPYKGTPGEVRATIAKNAVINEETRMISSYIDIDQLAYEGRNK